MAKRISRREFLGTAVGTAAAATAAGSRRPQAAVRPNIIFILADDLGYGDLSCYGRPDYQTPALDGLARQGMKFMSAYAAAPVCTPTRCAFATGRYPQRLEVGLREPLKNPDTEMDIGLPPAHPTNASRLKASGYDTALIGRWHRSAQPQVFDTIRKQFDAWNAQMLPTPTAS